MDIKLSKSTIQNNESIIITGSKSESNRLLILQALYPKIKIGNLSNSDDTKLLQKALQVSSSPDSYRDSIDIHHAGTAMRFLTAYFASQKGVEINLTGSARMKERPIKILVDALQSLGADISYLENEGFPPLKIRGKDLDISQVKLPANISSQYISALMLIAPKLKNGLEIELIGEITSIPYIEMTLTLLKQVNIEANFQDKKIKIKPKKELEKEYNLIVESDWSSASYWYSIVALSPKGTTIELSFYNENSLQGDSALAEIYEKFGVKTTYNKTIIKLVKTEIISSNNQIDLDLTKTPDIAQTIAVTAFGLGLRCDLTGLHTLKIKETDRLIAIKNELEKFGAQINITDNSLHLSSNNNFLGSYSPKIETYNDHRMAMAFAPLALKTNLSIKNAYVVSKSYPEFWDDLKQVGFQISNK